MERNDPCSCGSGRKYKKCCLAKDETAATIHRAEEQQRAEAAVEAARRARDKERVASDEQPMTTSPRPRCGLCGKTKNLTKTECCDEWICDDESNYVMFSYARNSCHRNHRRYTLCGYHHANGHSGDWIDCEKCRADFDTEDYVTSGTGAYNFRKLPNPPKFDPTRCTGCNRIIVRADGGFTISGEKYYCQKCVKF